MALGSDREIDNLGGVAMETNDLRHQWSLELNWRSEPCHDISGPQLSGGSTIAETSSRTSTDTINLQLALKFRRSDEISNRFRSFPANLAPNGTKVDSKHGSRAPGG